MLLGQRIRVFFESVSTCVKPQTDESGHGWRHNIVPLNKQIQRAGLSLFERFELELGNRKTEQMSQVSASSRTSNT